ncbi:multidrug efflux MFS transporter EmrD [Shewanella baltica]|uniref:multidrug efflux MFS transporter EmrD n=1 Tax=Shewanella baltica TaxID=62322 RepID=UPI00217D32B2|nr:multidrug efflux MFS transporter EmrD [Shewanella baltica]MCS6098841.1 multidrug efflux MFS transporter EmrD [Shewanella baltica]MCS6182203.1 multidrug efflux MFS transporter EmrD [Shewanella baltica]
MSGTPHSPIHHDVAPAASQSSLLLMIVFMVACGQMAQTIFVPALPQIALGLHVDASQLQAVMACYLLSYGMFQFVYGPVSDRVGRKMPLVVGIAIFIIGAVFAAQATSFNQLIMASLIQGLGTASAGALCRSIPRDHYFGDRLVKFNSYVSMAVVFLPLLAPFIGSASAAYFGWQAVYWVLAGFGAVVWLLLIFAFKESLPKMQREHQAVIASYRHVLRHRAFRAYLFSLIATFAGIAAFEAIAGVLYGQYLGLTPFMVSCYFVAPIPGYLLGALIAGRQNKPRRVIYQGVALLGAGALFMLIPGLFNLVVGWSLLVGSILFFSGAGMLFPTLTSAALEPFPRQAGIAGALLGGLQNFGAGLAALTMSLVPMGGQLSIGLLSAVMVVLVILSLYYARDQNDTHHNLMPQI